ncbi:MAG: 30S ribosomal protein S6 [Patescibacteria group bacterium]|jgi:small subunit ribosomal protein S6
MKNMHYELLYIIPLKYTDQENIEVTKEIDAIVKKYKGEIIKTAILGKRKLAYEINHVHTGYYVCTHFNMKNGEGLIGLNRELQLKTNDNVLRYQIVKTGIDLDEEKYKVMFGKKTQEEANIVNTREPKVEIEKKKRETKKEVTKEELDKKIEEIMDDDMKDLKK